jgi:hypothetical protein
MLLFMDKIDFKLFRHLMSAMLFISDVLDKDEQVNRLYVSYKQQNFESDPVVWAIDALNGCRPGSHDIYIRRSFAARTYQDLMIERLFQPN